MSPGSGGGGGRGLLLGTTLVFLVTMLAPTAAQVPVLDLFEGADEVDTFLVPVGAENTTEMNTLNFITNTDLNTLVTGVVENVVVTINGGSGNERIEGSGATLQVVNNDYQFSLTGDNITTEDYQNLIASFRYISVLSSEVLQDPPRNITVVANNDDGASQPSTALLVFLVSNQDPPVIDPRITLSVDENAPNGALVGQLNATDPEGLDVIFTFLTPSSVFAITSDGNVSVLDTDSLDYETQAQRRFELIVVATDTDPISPLTSEATLVINVNNANDNPPRFTLPMYQFSVTEGVANVEAGTLVATDDDQEPNTNTLGSVFFEILTDGIAANFELNRGTGIITVQPPGLDFEAVSSYTFEVRATDGIFSVTAIVQVSVIDIPDNRPVISPAQKTILIDLDARQREVFLTEGTGGQLMVNDPDSPSLQDGVATISVEREATVSVTLDHTFLDPYQGCIQKFELRGGGESETS